MSQSPNSCTRVFPHRAHGDAPDYWGARATSADKDDGPRVWDAAHHEWRHPRFLELDARIAALPAAKPGPEREPRDHKTKVEAHAAKMRKRAKNPKCPDCQKPSAREGWRCKVCSLKHHRECSRLYAAKRERARKTLIRRGRVLSEAQKHALALAMGANQ